MEIEVPFMGNLSDLTKADKKPIKRLAPRKKAMVEALGRSLGIVTMALKEVGISRETHYDWLKNDPIYKEAVLELSERKDDVIEQAFLNLVIDKNPQAVIHAVKTKLKHRGYGENQEITMSSKEHIDFTNFVKEAKDESTTSDQRTIQPQSS